MTINYNVARLGRNSKTENYLVQFDNNSGIIASNISISGINVNISGLLTINNIPISTSGHAHTYSNIIDFSSGVSGIIDNTFSNDIVGNTGVIINYDNINKDLIIGLNGLVPVVDIGPANGSVSINAGFNNSIQTISITGSPITLTKGNNWPVNNTCNDTILKITSTAATALTWNLVTDWFNQAPAGALASGVHLFLLRGVGSGIIEGHYIGNKTN